MKGGEWPGRRPRKKSAEKNPGSGSSTHHRDRHTQREGQMKALPTTLTPKQQRFCLYYLELGEGKASAIKAGYAPNSAAVTASDLLKMDKIRNYIEEERRDGLDRVRISADYVLEGLKREAEDSENSGGERIRALELLGKTMAMFVEKKIVHNTDDSTFFASIDLDEPVVEGYVIERDTRSKSDKMIERIDQCQTDSGKIDQSAPD